MALSMIWAMGKNREIGLKNSLPWHLPHDLKNFKKVTLGKPVLMGLTTFYSLGKPLPGRRNIVLNFRAIDIAGAEVALSIEDALERIKNENEAFVIGGASIYKQFLPLVDKLYITYIDHEFEADAFFPQFDMNQWKLISDNKGIIDEKNPYVHFYRVYQRIPA